MTAPAPAAVTADHAPAVSRVLGQCIPNGRFTVTGAVDGVAVSYWDKDKRAVAMALFRAGYAYVFAQPHQCQPGSGWLTVTTRTRT